MGTTARKASNCKGRPHGACGNRSHCMHCERAGAYECWIYAAGAPNWFI